MKKNKTKTETQAAPAHSTGGLESYCRGGVFYVQGRHTTAYDT